MLEYFLWRPVNTMTTTDAGPRAFCTLTAVRGSASFLTHFERVSAPLTAGLLAPVAADARRADDKRHQLDHLDQRVVTDLDALGRFHSPVARPSRGRVRGAREAPRYIVVKTALIIRLAGSSGLAARHSWRKNSVSYDLA